MIREDQIGQRIKQLRLARNLTQQVLAEMAGVTKGYLSKIENSSTSPPISTLVNITQALGLRLSTFFSSEDVRTSITLVKATDRRTVARSGSNFGYSYEPLAQNFPNRQMEPYIVTLPVNPEKKTIFQHKGQEMLYVMQGTMKFFYDDQAYIAEEGDCLYFDAIVPHYAVCAGNEEVRCLMVIYSPPLINNPPR